MFIGELFQIEKSSSAREIKEAAAKKKKERKEKLKLIAISKKMIQIKLLRSVAVWETQR